MKKEQEKGSEKPASVDAVKGKAQEKSSEKPVFADVVNKKAQEARDALKAVMDKFFYYYFCGEK